MGGAVSSGQDNDELIDNLKEAEYIKTHEVEKVFRIVDRAHYYLAECRENAYKDLAWKSGTLHLSAPCIYSEVMEALELKPGLSFLNLGSGTGYLSTMVGLMIGPYGINHGIELHPENVSYANEKLESFIKCCKRFDDLELCEPQFIVGNCLHLAPENRLYDRVYCGAACPPELKDTIQNMIKVNGILVIPVGDQLLKIKRTSETDFTSDNVLPVSFASLVQPGMGQKDVNPILLPDVNPLNLQCMCRVTIRNAIRSTFNFQLPPSNTTKPKKRRQIRNARIFGLNEDRYSLDLLPTTGGLMIMEAFSHSDDDEVDEDLSETSEDDDVLDVQLQHHANQLMRAKERALRNEHKEDSHEEVDSELSENEMAIPSYAATSKTEDFNGNRDGNNKADEDVVQESTDNSKQPRINDSRENNCETVQNHVREGTKNKMRKNKGKCFGGTTYRAKRFTQNNPFERMADRILNIMGPEKDVEQKSTPAKPSSSCNRSVSLSSDDDISIPKIDAKTPAILMATPPGPSTQPCAITASYSTSADTSETSGFGSLGDDALHVGSHHSTMGSFKDDIDVLPADCEQKKVDSGEDSMDPAWMEIDDEDSYNNTNNKSTARPVDSNNEDEKKCIDDEDYVNENDHPSEPDFSAFLKEKVHSLPIPSTLKAFILYYR